jgi:hypothetical protein
MICPLCGHRKAKRACPALGRQICAVCCGTKRLVEIRCTADCVYLATARTHPPAVVQRQQERDRGLLLPLLQGLTERQARLFLLFGAAISRHKDAALQKLTDDDIAQAAEALAGTLETAERGILYERQPNSLAAARLVTELKAMLSELSTEGRSASVERDAAIALRRIEAGTKETARFAEGAGTAFRELLSRVLIPQEGSAAQAEEQAQPSSIIVP